MNKLVAKFKERLSTEVKKQEKLDIVKEWDFRREELLEKYVAKILYRWDNEKLERNWQKWKLVSLKEKPWREIILKLKTVDFIYFYLIYFFHFHLYFFLI